MKIITVRLPEDLAAAIETESRDRGVPRSVVLRERLRGGARRAGEREPRLPPAIADLAGSVRGLPPDLSGRKREALRASGYGRPRPR